MALPKLETPKHSCTLPSDGQIIQFRPFLVGEQKMLLIAQESENQNDVIREMMRLIDTCTDDVSIENLPSIDIEFMFLQLRIKSIGETSNISIICEDENCKGNTEITIELESAKVIEPKEKVSPIIELTPKVSMELQFPSYSMMQDLDIIEGNIQTSEMFKVISKCVISIIDGDEVLGKDDFTEKELTSFIDSMSSLMFNDVQKFFDAAPKIVIEHDYTCSVCEKSNHTVIEGIGSFFD